MNDDNDFERDVMSFSAELYRRALGYTRNTADAEDGADTLISAESQAFRHQLDPDVSAAIEGMSSREAADIMGVPEGTVLSRMHRGRAGVRRSLGRAA